MPAVGHAILSRPGASEIATYREDGAVALRGVFEVEWIELLREGVERAIAAPSQYSTEYAGSDEGRFFTDHNMWRRHDEFRRFIFDSPVAAMAARLMGATKANIFDDHLLVKEAGTDKPTYWHHDMPYFPFVGEQICSLWIPLDPVDEGSGAMRFAVGSHRWGKLFRPIRIGTGVEVEAAESFDGTMPDIDADPDAYPTVCYPLQPGDCVAFHGRTVHSAGGNPRPDQRRRALALRFTGDDIRWHPRPFMPMKYAPDLADGDPMDCDFFPLVWPRA